MTIGYRVNPARTLVRRQRNRKPSEYESYSAAERFGKLLKPWLTQAENVGKISATEDEPDTRLEGFEPHDPRFRRLKASVPPSATRCDFVRSCPRRNWLLYLAMLPCVTGC